MLAYFIIFVATGFFIGVIFNDKEKMGIAILSIALITIAWAFIYGPWAVATLVELLIGYGLARTLYKPRDQ